MIILIWSKRKSCRALQSLIFPIRISDLSWILPEIAWYICFATLLITHSKTSWVRVTKLLSALRIHNFYIVLKFWSSSYYSFFKTVPRSQCLEQRKIIFWTITIRNTPKGCFLINYECKQCCGQWLGHCIFCEHYKS